MKDALARKELYLGCDCTDLGHVVSLIYFPFEGKDDEDNVIYYSVRVRNYFDRIVPPLQYFYEKDSWEDYFRYHWLRRVGIAAQYIFSPFYERKWGILDCFDFQAKDLSALDAFLALISSDIATNINHQATQELDNGRWTIIFDIDRMDFHEENFPWDLGWSPQFKHRDFWGRVGYAVRYMFGRYSEEQGFEISEKDAFEIRGMIKWVQENNKKDNDETTTN